MLFQLLDHAPFIYLIERLLDRYRGVLFPFRDQVLNIISGKVDSA